VVIARFDGGAKTTDLAKADQTRLAPATCTPSGLAFGPVQHEEVDGGFSSLQGLGKYLRLVGA
jgi:hypothetical protein